jgi:hypothetical protein
LRSDRVVVPVNARKERLLSLQQTQQILAHLIFHRAARHALLVPRARAQLSQRLRLRCGLRLQRGPQFFARLPRRANRALLSFTLYDVRLFL